MDAAGYKATLLLMGFIEHKYADPKAPIMTNRQFNINAHCPQPGALWVQYHMHFNAEIMNTDWPSVHTDNPLEALEKLREYIYGQNTSP